MTKQSIGTELVSRLKRFTKSLSQNTCDECHMACNERTGLELIQVDGRQLCDDCFQDHQDACCEWCGQLGCVCDEE